MEKTVTQCLKVSDEKNSSSIAFPALGAGNLGYPAKVVAKAMINAVQNYFQANKETTCIKEVKFVIFMDETYEEFETFLLKVSDCSASTRKVESHAIESYLVPEDVITATESSKINPSSIDENFPNALLPIKLCKGQLLSEKVIDFELIIHMHIIFSIYEPGTT